MSGMSGEADEQPASRRAVAEKVVLVSWPTEGEDCVGGSNALCGLT